MIKVHRLLVNRIPNNLLVIHTKKDRISEATTQILNVIKLKKKSTLALTIL